MSHLSEATVTTMIQATCAMLFGSTSADSGKITNNILPSGRDTVGAGALNGADFKSLRESGSGIFGEDSTSAGAKYISPNAANIFDEIIPPPSRTSSFNPAESAGNLSANVKTSLFSERFSRMNSGLGISARRRTSTLVRQKSAGFGALSSLLSSQAAEEENKKMVPRNLLLADEKVMNIRKREAEHAARMLFPLNDFGNGAAGGLAASLVRHTFGFDYLDNDFFLSF